MILEKIKEAPLSELIASLSALILIIGLSYKVGYYYPKPLLSLWVVSFFNPLDLAFAALKILFIYIFGLLIIDKTMFGESGSKNILVTGIWVILLPVAIGIYSGDFLTMLPVTLGMIAVLILIKAEKIARIICIVVLAIIIPFLQGFADVESDLKSNKLPKVYLANNDNYADDWRMLDKLNDRLLLINIKNPEQLKIVEISEITKIELNK